MFRRRIFWQRFCFQAGSCRQRISWKLSIDRQSWRLAICALVTAGVGCSGGPPALRPPALDPESAAEEAIALYDKDGDAALSTSELQSCPGLWVALKAYDQDNDNKISLAEIENRLQLFVDRETALTGLVATVTLDKQALVGAEVKFIPEPYLGKGIKPARATTQKRGAGMLAIDPADLPKNQQKIRGIHYGTYRVEITHPERDIPRKYNAETTLGYETQPGNPSVAFHLSSHD